MKTVTNEASFSVNPQMTQIDADGEKDKQTAQELERPMSGEAFDICRGPCAKGLCETGGWHNRLYNDTGARDSITGVALQICVHLFIWCNPHPPTQLVN